MKATIRESVVIIMKKQSALEAWRILILSLPKGIAAFVVAVAGLSVSLPLSVFLIGLPLLAATLVLCRQIMAGEAMQVKAWLQGAKPSSVSPGPAAEDRQGWRTWLLSVFREGRSYRGILFGIFQLPVGIAAFTIAVVLPVTAFAVLLSPAAYEVSMRLFDFNLFTHEWGLNRLFDWSLTPQQRSWIAGGAGLLFTLLLSPLLKGFCRWYAAWILSVSGPEPERRSGPVGAYTGGELAFAANENAGVMFPPSREPYFDETAGSAEPNRNRPL